jgi:hypothetical protein
VPELLRYARRLLAPTRCEGRIAAAESSWLDVSEALAMPDQMNDVHGGLLDIWDKRTALATGYTMPRGVLP